MITKQATLLNNYKRYWHKTSSAREAWSIIIEQYKTIIPNIKILLPAYIGWSCKEGSGIFDSVIKSGVNFDFYRLNNSLQINFEDLKNKLSSSCIVLIVNYFGFPDLNYKLITDYLKDNKIPFVEDCAHAWLSDLIGGVCGRAGNYTFYSLHKILPIKYGGMIVDNNLNNSNVEESSPFEVEYDLYSIYTKRRQNYTYLSNKLYGLDKIEILYPKLNSGICPQTLPLLISDYDRDKLYFEMNDKGFGVVSLYHTLIQDINLMEFPEAMYVSKHIINLPIHQDIEYLDIDEMISMLKEKLYA